MKNNTLYPSLKTVKNEQKHYNLRKSKTKKMLKNLKKKFFFFI